MKKIIFIALLSMAFITPTDAQDTVHYGDSCYLFNPINIADCRVSRQPFLNYMPLAYHRHSMLMCGYEYILPTETTIYGVATAMFRREENDNDSTGYIMYLYIIENDENLVCIDSITSYSRATHYMYSALDEDGNQVNSVAPCYEYFFDKPLVLSGAVYLGARWDRSYSGVRDPVCSAIDRNHSQHWIEFRNTDTPPQYYVGMGGYWGGYFPIIQPERIGCSAAVAEVNEKGDDYAVLAWDMDGDSCQLSITPYDMPFDPGAVIDLQNNTYTATGLDSGVYYAARLRTQCHHHCHIHADTVVWGNWGEPTLFYLGSQEPDTTGSLGIHQMSAEPSCNITPNPAHAIATVQCNAGIMGVEVLSVKGETLMHKDVAGEQACTLDLAGLSKGIYIVQVTTPQGTATRKLAVE